MLLCFLAGILAVYFQLVPAVEGFSTTFNSWITVIIIFAIVVGVASLTRYHFTKIRRKHKDIFYSYVVFVTLILMTTTGIIGYYLPQSAWQNLFNNLYRYVRTPLDATMFSLLAFYITSAAYRAFRARNWLATVLLIAGIIVMFGRVFPGPWGMFKEMTQWIMNVPNTAAMRAITIGVALGILATSIKILLGIERSYLGGGE